jgi:hypothetical protein
MKKLRQRLAMIIPMTLVIVATSAVGAFAATGPKLPSTLF